MITESCQTTETYSQTGSDSQVDLTELEVRINSLDTLLRNFKTILNRQSMLCEKLSGPQVSGAANVEEPPYCGQIGQLSQLIENFQKTFEGMSEAMGRLETII